MRIKKRREFHDEDAMAAMNDIMFFLLLFFLIISTMANPNVIRLLLPKSGYSSALNKQPITLSVTEDRRYYINQTEYQYSELEGALVSALGRNRDDNTVTVRMAKSLGVQDVTDIISIGAKLKLKMALSTVK